MGDYYFSKDAGRFGATNAGTNSGVTATVTAVTGQVQQATGVQCSGDLAALVTIESPASTVLWQKRFSAAFVMSETFPLGTIAGSSGAAILVKVSASTSHSEANIQSISRLG